MEQFKLVSKYKPTGDQPQAIKALVDGVNKGLDEQTLLGVTGSGKTFTMANVIAQVNKPTLVLAHNKTSVSFSLRMRLSILYLITITISPRHICLQPILI